MFFRFQRHPRPIKSRRPVAYRPRLEGLEDRCLLSAGTLDPTFGSGGIATDRAQQIGEDVVVQPSGNLVVVDDNGLSAVCFNPNGTLDTSFGSGGTVNPSFKNVSVGGGLDDVLYPNPNPQPGSADEKILVAGGGSSGKGHNAQTGFALVRYNANGTLDTAFGSGGLVYTPFANGGVTSATGVVVTSNGEIVVAGDNNAGFELARYTATGQLDTSFGSGGTVYTPITGFGESGIHSLAQEPNGDLIVVGWPGFVAVYSANGTLDSRTSNSAFGFMAAVAVYPTTDTTGNAGNIVVAGGTTAGNTGFELARYTLNNGTLSLDTSFGNGGDVTTPIGGGGFAKAVAIQADGKLVAGGRGPTSGVAALARYNPDGSLDSTFGTGGIVTTTQLDLIQGLALQPNGDIVTAGRESTSSGEILAVARYLSPAPKIGSFTASPNPVASGSNTTLTASNIPDGNPGSTITQVAFYVQVNGTNTLLGYATQTSKGSGVWTLSFSPSAFGLTSGNTYTVFAQAEDSDGIFGDPFVLNLSVM